MGEILGWPFGMLRKWLAESGPRWKPWAIGLALGTFVGLLARPPLGGFIRRAASSSGDKAQSVDGGSLGWIVAAALFVLSSYLFVNLRRRQAEIVELQRKTALLTAGADAAVAAVAKLQAEYSTATHWLTVKDREKGALARERDRLLLDLNDRDAHIARQEQFIERSTAQAADAAAELKRLNAEHQQHKVELTRIEVQQASAMEQMSTLLAEMNVVTAERDAARKRVAELQAELGGPSPDD